MANGTRIKGQAGAYRAGFHNLRPAATFPYKGKEENSSHITASRKRGGRSKDRPALPAPCSQLGPRRSAAEHRSTPCKAPRSKKKKTKKTLMNAPFPLTALLMFSSPSPPQEKMWIQVFGEKPGPVSFGKTIALVSEVWAEARVETSQLLKVQKKSQGVCSLHRLSPCQE